MIQQEAATKPKLSTTVLLLLLVAVILAAFFRFYKLDQIPPGFTFDEASHALDALDILRGQFMLLSPRLKETATGYMYLLAGVFQLFGTRIVVQRALTATFGLLLVPINFVAVRTLFSQEPGQKAAWIAVFSTLLLSTSFWAITASRIGYEYILPPVFALTATYFFWRGYRDERWRLLLLAGIFTAIGFYIYHGSAPFLLVIPTSLILGSLLYWILPQKSPAAGSLIRWQPVLFFSLAASIMALPLFLALTSGPRPEAQYSLGISFFSRAADFRHFGTLLTNSLIAHARPFLAIGGDARWLSNLQGRPILDPILATCFVIGILISLKRIKQLPYLFLLVYWGGMLIAPILTLEGSPFYFRMSGALPSTYIFIALTWAELYNLLKKWLATFKHQKVQRFVAWLALIPFLLIGLIWLPVNTYQDYFLIWASHPKTAFYHDVPVINLVERMEGETNPEAIFILPRKASSPRPNFTLDFLYQGQTPLLYLPVDEETVRQRLTSELAGYQTIHLITGLAGGREKDQEGADSTHLLPLLFKKYGHLQGIEENADYKIQTYRLNSNHIDFEAHRQAGLPPDFEPLSFIMAGQVKLVGIKRQITSDALFVDLAWQGWSRAVADFTVFIQLLDNKGQRVTGVDVQPDPGFTLLDRHEIMITHYTLPLSDVPSGLYNLLIGLYYLTGDELINMGATTIDSAVSVE